MPDELVHGIVGRATLEDPDATLYVGYLDGAPVSSGLGMRTRRPIAVCNIATVPAARRRGFGRRMTGRVAADGAAAGCDVAVLQASDMGRPIHERTGHRTVVEHHACIDPKPQAPT